MSLRLFLFGNVMTGRGIDQALPHSVNPVLYEPSVRDAREYVRRDEKTHGAIRRTLRMLDVFPLDVSTRARLLKITCWTADMTDCLKRCKPWTRQELPTRARATTLMKPCNPQCSIEPRMVACFSFRLDQRQAAFRTIGKRPAFLLE